MRAAVALALLTAVLAAPAAAQAAPARVLVFSKTAGFRHDAIAPAVATIRALGRRGGFTVRAAEDARAFRASSLRRYDAVVFLMTTGDVLAPAQQRAFGRWVRAGGGWAGVHSAADTEYGWSFYGTLLAGAWFRSHPAIQRATVVRTDRRHPSTRRLPARWTRTDEWYAFRASPRGRSRVLLRVDESSYDAGGSSMGADHPLAWCRRVGRGRAWYTALGHTSESYAEPAFRRHLLGGIRSVAGLAPADCRAG